MATIRSRRKSPAPRRWNPPPARTTRFVGSVLAIDPEHPAP